MTAADAARLAQIRDRSHRLAEVPLDTRPGDNCIVTDLIESAGDVKWLLEQLQSVRGVRLGHAFSNGWYAALNEMRAPGYTEREAAWRKYREEFAGLPDAIQQPANSAELYGDELAHQFETPDKGEPAQGPQSAALADVMHVPMADRTAAIHAKYMAFGFSGPTDADRERDQVIGWLLDQLPTHDPAAKFASDMARLRKNDPGGAQWVDQVLAERAKRAEQQAEDVIQFRVCQSPRGVIVDWTDLTIGDCMWFRPWEESAGQVRLEFRTERRWPKAGVQ